MILGIMLLMVGVGIMFYILSDVVKWWKVKGFVWSVKVKFLSLFKK